MCWTLYTQDTRQRQTKYKHNTICVGHPYSQDTRQRQTKYKHNTISVGHPYKQDTRQRQTKYKHNTICVGPSIHKTQDKDKQNKNTTQYVLDTPKHNQPKIA
jgi:hypothetical protein